MSSPFRHPLLARLIGVVVRLVLIVGLVGGSGWALGQALGVPVRLLPDFSAGGVTLDQETIALSLNPAEALVQADDLPRGWKPKTDLGVLAFGIIGAEWCGKTPEVRQQQGTKKVVAFENAETGAVITSEYVRVDRPSVANAYVGEVADALSCASFYRVLGVQSAQYRMLPTGRRVPVSDYTARLIQPKDLTAGGVQEVVFFQVGDLIVALQYVGKERPPTRLMNGVEESILLRTAKQYYRAETTVPGAQTLPVETTASIPADPGGAVPAATTSVPPPVLPTAPAATAPQTTQAGRRTSGAAD